MKKNISILLLVISTVLLAACSQDVSSEVMVLHEEIEKDNSRDAVVDLITAITENQDYQQELSVTINELKKSIATVSDVELESKEAKELKELYLSSLEDYQNMADRIQEEGVTDENVDVIDKLAASANEKQKKYLSEIVKLGDFDIPTDVQ